MFKFKHQTVVDGGFFQGVPYNVMRAKHAQNIYEPYPLFVQPQAFESFSNMKMGQ